MPRPDIDGMQARLADGEWFLSHDEVRDLLAYVASLEDKIERRRMRLVNAEADLLDIRGVLSPSGEDRKVPFELGDRVAPAIEWLVVRVAELQARVDVLTDTVNGRDEQIARLRDALRERIGRWERQAAEHGAYYNRLTDPNKGHYENGKATVYDALAADIRELLDGESAESEAKK